MVAALLAAAAAGAPRAAWAWGSDGHVIVARIAERHLSPRARQRLRPLLDGRSLADIASWADDWRDGHPETAPWHFVDIPLAAAGYDASRDCPRGACAVDALAAQIALLRDRAAPIETRRRALRFVVHLLADLHQPLHAATDDAAPGGSDRGGNTVKARLSLGAGEFPYHSAPTGNLHAIWDSDLIDSQHRQQEAYVAALAKLPEPIARLQAGTLVDWANEAHQVARDVVYRDLPPPDAAGVRQLDEGYAARCRPAIEKQLQRAGVRLARVLDESF
jgi:nuclease S1